MSTLRHLRSAALGLLATLAVAGGSLAAAGPAQAATTYREYENVSSQFDLVMSARGTAAGSAVGLGPDNDSSLAQWRRQTVGVSGDGRTLFQHVLRASEPTGPKCLDVQNGSTAPGATIVIQPCDGRMSQKWTMITATVGGTISKEFRNEKSGLLVRRINGPEFTTNLVQFEAVNGSLFTERVSLVIP